eukprot:14094466-Alexandrium_andersonii.AAC.1
MAGPLRVSVRERAGAGDEASELHESVRELADEVSELHEEVRGLAGSAPNSPVELAAGLLHD